MVMFLGLYIIAIVITASLLAVLTQSSVNYSAPDAQHGIDLGLIGTPLNTKLEWTLCSRY
jgi:hypothetical protein